MVNKWIESVVKDMESVGALVVPMLGNGAASGWPDRLVVWRGWTFWIEFKAAGDALRKNQDLNLQAVADHGGMAVVAYQENSDCDSIYFEVYLKNRHYKLRDVALAGAALLLKLSVVAGSWVSDRSAAGCGERQ